MDLGEEDSDETDRSDKEEWEVRSTSGDDDDDKVSEDDYDYNDDFIDDDDEETDRDTILYKEFIAKMSENKLGVKHMFNKENAANKRLIEDVVNNLQSRNAEISDYDAAFIRNDNLRMQREKARAKKLLKTGKANKTCKKKSKRPDLASAVLKKKFRDFTPAGGDDSSDEDEIIVWSDSDEDRPKPGPIVKKEPEDMEPSPQQNIVGLLFNKGSPRRSPPSPVALSPKQPPTKIRKPSTSDNESVGSLGPECRKLKKKTSIFESNESVDLADDEPAQRKKKWGLINFLDPSRSEPRAETAMAPVRSRILASAESTKKRRLPPSVTGENADKSNKYDEEMVERVLKMHAGISPYQFETGKTKRTHPEIRTLLFKLGYKTVPTVSTISRMILLKTDPAKLEEQEKAKRARAKEKRNKATEDLKKLTAIMQKNIERNGGMDDDECFISGEEEEEQ